MRGGIDEWVEGLQQSAGGTLLTLTPSHVRDLHRQRAKRAEKRRRSGDGVGGGPGLIVDDGVDTSLTSSMGFAQGHVDDELAATSFGGCTDDVETEERLADVR